MRSSSYDFKFLSQSNVIDMLFWKCLPMWLDSKRITEYYFRRNAVQVSVCANDILTVLNEQETSV